MFNRKSSKFWIWDEPDIIPLPDKNPRNDPDIPADEKDEAAVPKDNWPVLLS